MHRHNPSDLHTGPPHLAERIPSLLHVIFFIIGVPLLPFHKILPQPSYSHPFNRIPPLLLSFLKGKAWWWGQGEENLHLPVSSSPQSQPAHPLSCIGNFLPQPQSPSPAHTQRCSQSSFPLNCSLHSSSEAYFPHLFSFLNKVRRRQHKDRGAGGNLCYI